MESNRKSLKGAPDLRHGKNPKHSERMKRIYAEKREDTELLLEIARESALEVAFEDLDHVTIQMSKRTWAKLQARASRT